MVKVQRTNVELSAINGSSISFNPRLRKCHKRARMEEEEWGWVERNGVFQE